MACRNRTLSADAVIPEGRRPGNPFGARENGPCRPAFGSASPSRPVPSPDRTEPPRVYRRRFCLSQAATADLCCLTVRDVPRRKLPRHPSSLGSGPSIACALDQVPDIPQGRRAEQAAVLPVELGGALVTHFEGGLGGIDLFSSGLSHGFRLRFVCHPPGRRLLLSQFPTFITILGGSLSVSR